MNSILIVHQGAIGDFVLSLPAMEAIHRFYPGAHFTFIAHPAIVEIIQRRPYFKQVFDCSDRCWTSLYSSEGKVAGVVHDLLPQVESIQHIDSIPFLTLIIVLVSVIINAVNWRSSPFPPLLPQMRLSLRRTTLLLKLVIFSAGTLDQKTGLFCCIPAVEVNKSYGQLQDGSVS